MGEGPWLMETLAHLVWLTQPEVCARSFSLSRDALQRPPGVVVIPAGVGSPAEGRGLSVAGGGGSAGQGDYQLLR